MSPTDIPDPGFLLSQTDGRPMYLQIMEQVRQRVAVGDWGPGTKLPSIRQLAVATKVSVITVKRAYLELEREGVIATQHGKGSWVRDGETQDELRDAELERHLEQAAGLAAAMGLTAEALQERLARHLGNHPASRAAKGGAGKGSGADE